MKIRHEINLLNGPIVGSSSVSEKAYFDASKYSGTITLYLEGVHLNNTPVSGTMFGISGSISGAMISNIDVPANQTAYAVYRSTSPITISPAQDIYVSNSGGTLKAARLVIIQDTGTDNLSSTQAQFEIGNRETGKTNTTSSALTYPKYWKWEPAKWSGKVRIDVDVVSNISDAMATYTVRLERSVDGGSTWSAVAAVIVNSGSNTTVQRTVANYQTDALADPSHQVGGSYDGALYRITANSSSSMVTYNIYSAKIIITQEAGYPAAYRDGQTGTSYSGVYGEGAGATNLQKVGQSITALTSASFTKVRFYGKKIGAPTDSIYCELRSTSPTGTLIATSNNVALSGVSTSEGWVEFTFPAAQSLTAASTYGLVIRRTLNGYDTANAFTPKISSVNAYTGGNLYYFDTAGWNQNAFTDFLFEVVSGDGITKTQEQYLMGNTVLAASNSPQDFLTKWDPSEWDGVSNAYRQSADASSANTADVSVIYMDGASIITVNTMVDPTYHGIGSAFTMPGTTKNLDVKIPGGSDVYSAGILVDIVKAVAPAGSMTAQTIAGLATASGTLKGTGALSGSAAGSTTTSGNLTQAATISQISGSSAGAATASATLSGKAAAAGSSAGIATTSATLSATGSLAGTSAGIATATGSLQATGVLSGTSEGSAATSGLLEGSGALMGSIAAAATVTGDLDADTDLRASAAGTSTASATLSASGSLEGQGVAASSATASLQGTAEATATASGSANTVATLTALAQVSASISSSANAQATLVGEGALQGSAAGSSTASAGSSAEAPIEGSTAGTSTATATLSGIGTAILQAEGSSSATATLKGIGALSANAAGTAESSATLTGTGALEGSAAGSSTATISAPTLAEISGSAAGSSTASATMNKIYQGQAVASGAATATGTLSATGNLVGAAGGWSSVSATISTQQGLAGAINGSSSATGTLRGTAAAVGASHGNAFAVATIGYTWNYGQLSGAILGWSVVHGTMNPLGTLSGSAEGRATATATLSGTADMQGTAGGSAMSVAGGQALMQAIGIAEGSSSAVGSIAGTAAAAGSILCVSTVEGLLRGDGKLSGFAEAGSSALANLQDLLYISPAENVWLTLGVTTRVYLVLSTWTRAPLTASATRQISRILTAQKECTFAAGVEKETTFTLPAIYQP